MDYNISYLFKNKYDSTWKNGVINFLQTNKQAKKKKKKKRKTNNNESEQKITSTKNTSETFKKTEIKSKHLVYIHAYQYAFGESPTIT